MTPMTGTAPRSFVQRQEIDLPADAPDSFAHFQVLVEPMFRLVRLQAGQPFYAHTTVAFLPDLVLSRASSSPARFERDELRIAKYGLDDILVIAYLQGGFRCEVDGVTQTVQAGEIAFFDLARPFCIESEQVHNIALHVSRRRLGQNLPASAPLHGLVLRHGAIRELLLAQMKACHALSAQITTAESAVLSDALLPLVAGGLKHAQRQAAAGGPAPVTASLTDITGFIEAHLARPDLGPDELTRSFGLSRATLYRLFEPLGGVAAYIQDRRLQRALQAITAPESSHLRLKQLAHAVGFVHPASFTRAFKKRFGMPPHEVRSLSAYPDDVHSAAWRQALASRRPLVEAMKPRGAVLDPSA